MNRSNVMQQWLATPDNKTTEIRYPLAIDFGVVRITGNSTPPSKMSDTASDARNPLVYVLRDLLVTTRRHIVTLASTINTDKIAIKAVITEFSAIVLTCAVTHDSFCWWFRLIVSFVYNTIRLLQCHDGNIKICHCENNYSLSTQVPLQTLWGTVSDVRDSFTLHILISAGISQFLTIVIKTQSRSSLIRQSNLHLHQGVKIHFYANENAQ